MPFFFYMDDGWGNTVPIPELLKGGVHHDVSPSPLAVPASAVQLGAPAALDNKESE